VAGIDEMELRLGGTGLADGEITFAGLASLTGALQQLAMRVGRHLTGREGAGRSTVAVERATELRLTGTSAGSTILSIAVGEADVLLEGLEHRTTDGLFSMFAAMAADEPPAWTTPLLGEAAVSVIDALAGVAAECELTSASRRHAPVRLLPRTASRSVWPVSPESAERRPGVSVSGQLDLVDLRRSRFRIRDQVGNDIALEQVANASAAAPLVGTSVTAIGEAILGVRGQIVALVEATVASTPVPDWIVPALTESMMNATPPPTGGIADVDDDEVAAFLALFRE